MNVSEKAKALILSFEDLEQATWPGGQSGVTIGHGYDLGYHNLSDFRSDWSPYLPDIDLQRLAPAIGKKGPAARDIARSLRGLIEIPAEEASEVFCRSSLPRYAALTVRAFPGIETLPVDAQGAMVSVVFNRGASMQDADPAVMDRLEMRNIRDTIATHAQKPGEDTGIALHLIAENIRSMRRLWVWRDDADSWRQLIPNLPLRIINPPAKPQRGLQLRREQEARLVESCVTP